MLLARQNQRMADKYSLVEIVSLIIVVFHFSIKDFAGKIYIFISDIICKILDSKLLNSL